MHWKSGIIDKVIKENFESLSSRNQTDLKEWMKGSDFIFHCINLFHYKCFKIWTIVDHI